MQVDAEPAADGSVTVTFGGSPIYTLTDTAIVTFWQPSFPERLNEWNKLSVGNAGLPGPVDFVVAEVTSCLAGLPEPHIADTLPTCCDTPNPITGPDPIGALTPWIAACVDGGVVDSVADLTDGEYWG